MIRMNEIFSSLACYGQKLFFLEIETNINTSSVKRSGEEKIETIFLKSDVYAAF